MKKNFLLLVCALLPITLVAQEKKTTPTDTIIHVNGRKYIIKEKNKTLNIKVYGKTQKGDTIADDMIYEATYNDEQATERRFEFSTPFSKNKKRNVFRPHYSGIYIGYSELNDNFGPGNAPGVNLNFAQSGEFGFNLFNFSLKFLNNNNWGLTSGLGLSFSTFRLNGNYAFVDNDGTTILKKGDNNIVYGISRIKYIAYRLPICVEWQQSRRNLFLSSGFEIENRVHVRSKAKVNDHETTLGRGMNVYPLGANFILQGGYNNIGFYMRYSITTLFRDNQGPEIRPWSMGISWYW